MEWMGKAVELAKNPQALTLLLCIILAGESLGPRLPFFQSASDKAREEILEGQAEIKAKSSAREEELLQELQTLKAEIQANEAKERELRIKREVTTSVELMLRQALEEVVVPLTEKIDKIDSDLRRGSRWTLEDEVAMYEANGSTGPDPREIQADRLAAEHREFLKNEGN